MGTTKSLSKVEDGFIEWKAERGLLMGVGNMTIGKKH
jgi:hypothetical protein